MEQIIEKWEEILRTVNEEHELTDISFKTWLEPLKVFDVKDNTLYILVPDEQMGLNYITKKYTLPIKVAVAEIIGKDYEIEFVLPEQAKSMRTPKPMAFVNTETNWLMQLHWLLQNLREKSITHSFYMEAQDLVKRI